ncbi:MAG: hypothetical protein KDA77_20910, partial [Planctomycetaceae bacterium]|nr:hypothetical protein [Planctomycetaceae bacterium]
MSVSFVRPGLCSLLLLSLWVSTEQGSAAELTPVAAKQAMKKATHFFTSDVSTDGGYLWRYSEDLSLREGEEKATDSMVWVQPPGTPTVGEAFLNA